MKIVTFLMVTILLWESTQGQTCSTTNTGRLKSTYKSPNYPLNYPPSTQCSLTITVPSGMLVTVGFDSFILEFPTGLICHDYVQIYDGLYTVLGTFCGSGLLPAQVSTGQVMKIEFNSDSVINRKGFHALYEATDTTCGNAVLRGSTSGYLRSPNYPGFYPAGSHCVWRIEAAVGSVIQLQFLSWSLESGCSLFTNRDNVTVYDGETRVLGRFCGSSVPPTLSSTGRRIKVTFNSDSTLHYRGFYIKWSVLNSLPQSYSCGVTDLTASSGTIRSPNYPSNYPNSATCTWRIRGPIGSTIKVTFVSFSIESGCHDYMALYDGESDLKGYYCGKSYPREFTSTTNLVKIYFFSDTSLTQSGFRLDWSISGSGCKLRCNAVAMVIFLLVAFLRNYVAME